MSPPTSPTSLLWAYQLKLEHSHLLDRVKTLESSTKLIQERLNLLEAGHEKLKVASSHDAQLVVRIADLEKHRQDVQKHITHSEEQKEVQNARETNYKESIEGRLRNVECSQKEQHEKNEARFSREAEAAKKVAALEETLQLGIYTKAEPLLKKTDVDVKVISRRVDAIEALRIQESSMLMLLSNKVSTLEQANLNPYRAGLENITEGHVKEQFAASRRRTPQLISSPPASQVQSTPLVEKLARNWCVVFLLLLLSF